MPALQKYIRRLALIFKCFKSRYPALLARAFVTCVRRILDIASSTLAPYAKIYIDKMKHIRRYFINRLKRMYNLPHRERLCDLVLYSLHIRVIQSELAMLVTRILIIVLIILMSLIFLSHLIIDG